MKPLPLALSILGGLLALAGLVFTLQGEAIVGPESSFMFQNPTWVYQGVAVLLIGVLILAYGILLSRR